MREREREMRKINNFLFVFFKTGFTDSSDDEENKYFEEGKYNSCGKELKNLIKPKVENLSKSKDVVVEVKYQDRKFSSNSRLAREKLLQHLEENLKKNDVERGTGGKFDGGSLPLVDPVLKMRIVNPLVSSTVLKEKMIGRVSISTSSIKNFIKTENYKNTDWVTGGVIVNKICKTSQKGNQYCIWNLTDLHGDIKTITVFLFGTAYNEFWKTSVGIVVGILNPAVMEGNEKSEATLKVDNSYKLLLMGTSKDYGICKSKKKNGENCYGVVNKAKCEYCNYHLKKEYTKASRRSDLIPPKVSANINNFRKNTVNNNNNKNIFGNVGKSFTGIRGKKSFKNVEKDQNRLKSLSDFHTPMTSSTPLTQKKNIDHVENPRGNVMNFPSVVKPEESKRENEMINLNVPITKKERNAARIQALNYVRKHGPIKRIEEGVGGGGGKQKRTPEQIKMIKRKLEEMEEKEGEKCKKMKGEKEGSDVAENDSDKKKKFEKIGMTEKFFQLMNSEVKNKDLLNTAETEMREKYFNKLETREKMEDKMASIYKMECNAVVCLKCNYKTFSASEMCKRDKHPLKVVKATKRFWKCGKCSYRTVTLELVPLVSCKNCGGSKWERTSLMPEKGPNLNVEPLSLRGFEEKFIGSTIGRKANLNLLVPEESS